MVVDVRVGQGVDVHPFSSDGDRRLVLGGVRIPDEPALAGHSDADVILHATVDALLGAAGLGDIGTLFGSEDPEYAGADSQLFLAGALSQIEGQGWQVGNIDITLIGLRPRIGPYRDRICGSLATLLGITPAQVNLKATTSDGLGFTGRGEGVACMATVLLQSAHPA
ncbi:MAG: 2-C-methyl-D-erythritol 2,4-cyclodiphosphate synthase [Actinobacteria bacterium]|nr:2-C-methyl-D-erythritol 2,4-cyclodiphosphate synthase [Actinomycetota bacterium]